MVGSVARRRSHPGRGDHQCPARVSPGGQGGEGAGFDPQHAFRRGAERVRGGETRLIPAEELVPGDIVLLESGDRIPADLRLVDVKNLRTEEAALTGESVPIDKTTGAVPEKATVGDREGMAFSGTLVSSGRGDGSGRRHRERHRAGTHQSVDGRGECAGDAAAAPDQEVRLRDHRRDRRGERDRVRLRQMGPRHGLSWRSFRRSSASPCR